jgi:hypothetical protein
MQKKHVPGIYLPASSSFINGFWRGIAVLVYLFFWLGSFHTVTAQEVKPDKGKNKLHKSERKFQRRHQRSDSLVFERKKEKFSKTDKFYKKLDPDHNNSKVLSNLHPLLFKSSDQNDHATINTVNDDLPFTDYEGKIIRTIHLKKLDAFGTSVYDTLITAQSRLEKVLNTTHVNTHNKIIRNYLLIDEGDPLNPRTLSDNEKLLREISIFEDARFYVHEIPGNDSVDLVLAIKDIFPLGIDLTIKKLSNSKARLYNKNLLGLGNQLEQSMEYDTRDKPHFYLTKGAYTLRNIRGTFIDAKSYWRVQPDARGLGMDVVKPFITPETRFGGGIKIEKLWKNFLEGTNSIKADIPYLHYDIWAGYAPVVERFSNLATPLRMQAYFLGRINKVAYYNSIATNDSLYPGHYNFSRKLVSIGLLWSGYVRRNMILGFGRTEDIPVGALIETTFGRSDSDRETGFYTGIRTSKGINLNSGAHIFTSLGVGGFWDDKKFTNGALNINTVLISKLYQSGPNRIRIFGAANYTLGINRDGAQLLEITPDQFPTTYNHFSQKGQERLNFKTETVVFTPIYLLGFRIAFYGFGELAFIANKPGKLFRSSALPAVGLGIKVRNEHLVFSTFRIGFTWYPVANDKNNHFLFDIGDQETTGMQLLQIHPPTFIDYR